MVDEGGLVAALEAGRLGGAGLNVYEREPAVPPGPMGRSEVVLLPTKRPGRQVVWRGIPEGGVTGRKQLAIH